MDTQTRKSSINIPAIILCAVIIAVAGISYIRKNQEKVFPQQAPAVARADFADWMKAVEGGNVEKAVAYATRISGGCDMRKIPDSDYLKLAADMKFSTLVYDAPFGKADFARWKDAFAVRKLISGVKADADEIENIAKAVSSKIECRPTPAGKLQAATISEIIDRGFGNTHEITRVLCEAFYQAGYETMTVSIFEEKSFPAHLVSEIRGKGHTAVVDSRFKKVWKDMVFAKLAQDPSLAAGVWPENIAKSAKNYVYGLPAEVQDYRIFNQNLQNALVSSGFAGTVRLAEDPRKRIERYLMHFESPEKVPATYWRYPFIVLLSQPDFPAGWRLNYEKLLEQK